MVTVTLTTAGYQLVDSLMVLDTLPDGLDDTDHLLMSAITGNKTAIETLLERHRNRLRRMIALRLDVRLAARVDPSDVVQEALADAAKKLADYAPCARCLSTRGCIAWQRSEWLQSIADTGDPKLEA